MRVQIGDAVVEVELTDLQKGMLAAGNSVTVNLYPDPDHREYTVKDMGFTSPRRVHVDSAKHPNPAVDAKRLAAELDRVIQHERSWHYRGTAADLNYGDTAREVDESLDTEFDPVERPEHYVDGREIEPIDVIDDWTLGFYEGQVLKYIARAGRKTDSELEDLKKARWYIDRRISMIEKGEE